VKIGQIQVDFLAHVCFRFRSPGRHIVLTDPLFADGFEWEGHRERYLSPPKVPIKSIAACDVIFVSHIHGDHFDPDAVMAIQDRTGAEVLAPAEVLEALQERGADVGLLVEAGDGTSLEYGDMMLSTFAGYDNSLDERGRANKFSLVLECGDTRIFYSGDCHELPPRVRGAKVDAMFCWPHTDDERLKALARGLQAERFVLMHCDRFEPGDFLCNRNLRKEKTRLERLLPGMKVVAPLRATRLS